MSVMIKEQFDIIKNCQCFLFKYVVKLNWFQKFEDRKGPLKKFELAAFYCQALN